MRPIDADALKKSVPNTHVDIFENCRNCELLDDEQVEELIDNAPTIDAVPVVRCKDCKHFKSETENTGICDGGFCHAPVHVAVVDFCSYGERKGDE